ncbi:transglutaminase domain-containing protein [Geodermatophilaceae bacterium NBWT11]|nr:transglutaminase domain-containing protein [Geodermatophilaceae bacterium NBWT11]
MSRTGWVGSSVAAAVAVLLGSLALGPVFAAGSWFPPGAFLVVVVAATGLAVRALLARTDRADGVLAGLLPPLVQVLAAATALTVVFTPGRAWGGVLPTPGSLAELGALFAEGASEIQEQATPALPLTGLVALTTLFLTTLALAVDLVAVAGRQPTLGGLALLVLACIPVATVTGDVSLVAFLGPAVGFGVLLWADQRSRLADRARSGPGAALGTGTLPALRTGVLALVAGILLPAFVPMLAEGSFATGLGTGDGPGGGSSTGTALDPQAALQGQLTQPTPIDLLTLDTTVVDPEYLRAVALDEYTDEGWGIGNLDGTTSVADSDELAPLPGGVDSRRVTARITAVEHADRFLPVFASPLSVEVTEDDGEGSDDGPWRLDADSSTVFGRDGARTSGRSWEVVAQEARPTAGQLAQSRPLPADDPLQAAYTALPELDPRVTALVDQLTDDGQSPAERVQAVYGFLTDRANGFVYSLTTEPGTTGDDLADFLELRRGYCEQYAGAMAVLTRAAGVPSRVVLGYTPGDRQPDGTRLITTADAHAWVEVWFDGLGWVPYDPTPIDVARRVDLPWAPRADGESGPTDQAPEAVPTAAGGLPTAELDRDDQFTPLDLPSTQQAGTPWGVVAAGTGGTLLLAALLATPGLLRRARRRRRLSSGSAGDAWDELLATTTDLGVPVAASGTPRQVARGLAEMVAPVDRPAVTAVRDLALALEASVYGRPAAAGTGADLAVSSAVVDRALRATVRRRDRWRSRVWPASTVEDAVRWVAAHTPRRRSTRPA